LGATLGAQQKIALVGAGSSETPSGHALHVLREALQRRGIPFGLVGSARERKHDERLLTISTGLELPAESFTIRKAPGGIMVAGTDAVGLAYGIFELLGQVEASTSPDLLHDASNIERHPKIKVRSMAMSLLNRDLEREWYFSKEFWNAHFALM